MLNITKEQWSKLDSAQQDLIRSLGVTVNNKRPPLRTPKAEELKNNKPIKAYYLGVITTCTLCGADMLEVYFMFRRKGRTSTLEARHVKDPGGIFPEKWRHYTTCHCSQCPHRLARWTKRELYHRLLSEVKNPWQRLPDK